ncbi:MAG: choice-of-anchor D domain-containing protein [Archangium sp.]|nr:choice-of-anchor D domain-containing protein [Archangium sp.]MDP3151071.1 choice-of-anchor D domain-containing protein [Archangium sp.]MDP3571755.1 choice-of-anchor D domain-containing protein [Archangium sp.]
MDSGVPGVPVAAVTPAAIDFDDSFCGAASTKALTVTNSGTGPLSVSASTGTSSTFSVTPANTTIAAGASVTFTVTATVAATAAAGTDYAGLLTLTTNAATAKVEVPLTAKAKGVTLTLTPTVASFGVLPVATVAPALPLTLTNTGNVPATISFTQPVDTQFSLQWLVGSPSGFMLAPGASVTGLQAGFTAARITPSSGSAEIEVSEAICGSSISAIPMTGQGTNGSVSLSTTDVFFGTNGRVNCGTTAGSKTLVLSNTGNQAFSWTATLVKGAASPFTFSPMSGTVPANTGTVTITLTTTGIPAEAPTADDAFGDVLNIVTDVANDEPHPVNLHQTANGAVLSFAPNAVDFGLVPVNTTTTAPLAVVNAGNTSPMVTLTSSNAKFTLDPMSPLAAASGSSTVLTGTYAPGTAVLPETAAVTLTLDAAEPLCAPLPAALPLTGQGTSGSVSFSPVAVDFGAVNCGTTAAPRTVTFRNDGNQAYTVTPVLGRDAGSPFVVTMAPATGVVGTDGGTVVITVAPNGIPQTSAVTPDLYGDTLTVSTDVSGDLPRAIPLRLTARGSIFAISTTAINFGSVAVGATASSQFTVSNSGNAVGGLVFTPGQPNIFGLPSNAQVNPNSSTGQTGTLTPMGTMSYSDTASIAAAPGTVLCQPLPFTTMSLAGAGSAGNVMALSTSSLTFGNGGMVPCGTTATARTVTVTNNSAQALTLALELARGTSSPYNVTGPTTVAAGATVTVTVSPKMVPATSSTAPDAFGDTLSITGTGGPVNEVQIVALHETAEGAVLTLNPASLSLTDGQTKNFTVNNTGNLSAPYTIAVGGANPGSFAVTPTSGTAGAGGSVMESARYNKPLLSGPQSATVSVGTAVVRCAPLPTALTLSGN